VCVCVCVCRALTFENRWQTVLPCLLDLTLSNNPLGLAFTLSKKVYLKKNQHKK
jgi:hypothetical protein